MPAKPKFQKPRLLADGEISFIRGKASVGHATPQELLQVFDHYTLLEQWLDEKDSEDYFGTEGWRHTIGMPGAD